MSGAADGAIWVLAAQAVDGPLEAGDFFRPRIELVGGPRRGDLIMLAVVELARLVRSLNKRKQSVDGLPRPTYLALTESSVYALEFRFGSATRLRRIVARWPRAQVRCARPAGEPFSIDFSVGGRVAELQAMNPGPKATDVIDRLCGPSTR